MNLTQDFVNKKLVELNGNMLKPFWRKKWSKDNPTLGYCYIISEAIFHFANREYLPYCMNYGEKIGIHWFLRDKDGDVVDFTKEQFDFTVDHNIGKRKNFLKGGIQTKRGWISKRGYEMAKHLELINEVLE